jgi:hypothetical protein
MSNSDGLTTYKGVPIENMTIEQLREALRDTVKIAQNFMLENDRRFAP